MAVIAAAAALALLVPLYRGRDDSASAEGAMAIYRDQLGEVDRDVARGVIPEAEAGAARTEIARRLIRESETAPAPQKSGGRTRTFAAVAVVAAPIVALGLYLTLGSPWLPDLPLAARQNDPQDITALIAKVEQHLVEAPDDGKGWELLAPIYVKLGRYDDAVKAYKNVIRTLGTSSVREADLGEAMIGAAGGALTPDARAAFKRAHDLDPADPRPRYYLALALGADGKKDEAIAAWKSLIADAPTNAPWLPAAKGQLARLQENGPTAAQVEAAGQLGTDQRLAMIEGMVSTLAAKLAANPDNVDGWARLIRSFMVLNRPDDARKALSSGLAAFPDDAAKRAQIEAAAREAGLKVEGQ